MHRAPATIVTPHKSEARRSSAVADEICAILGRELRSPVAAALKRARLAERGMRQTEDPAEVRALVDAVNQAVERLDAIVTRIIGQARRPRRGSPVR